ncbi:hypothetical protein N9R59_06330 [Porticoccaceae bacterium]|nr:hypothetical protein [Porticoccaceae bacterium]
MPNNRICSGSGNEPSTELHTSSSSVGCQSARRSSISEAGTESLWAGVAGAAVAGAPVSCRPIFTSSAIDFSRISALTRLPIDIAADSDGCKATGEGLAA